MLILEKYQLEIIRFRGLPPLLRLLQSTFLPLILSSVACIRNISIHPLNESSIIDVGFLPPLIQLLACEESEEVQCHSISTLRNLAASSERNKRAIVNAGAVEKIKELVFNVPFSVQSEMTAFMAVLALSGKLHVSIFYSYGYNCCLMVNTYIYIYYYIFFISFWKDELKPKLLKLGICEILLRLTNSKNVEVQGNSAAALGNLSSKSI